MGWFEDVFRIPTVEDMIKPSTPDAITEDYMPIPDLEIPVSNAAIDAYIKKVNAENPNIITATTASALKAVGDVGASLLTGAKDSVSAIAQTANSAASTVSAAATTVTKTIQDSITNIITTPTPAPSSKLPDQPPHTAPSPDPTPTPEPTKQGISLGLIVMIAAIAAVAYIIFRRT